MCINIRFCLCKITVNIFTKQEIKEKKFSPYSRKKVNFFSISVWIVNLFTVILYQQSKETVPYYNRNNTMKAEKKEGHVWFVCFELRNTEGKLLAEDVDKFFGSYERAENYAKSNVAENATYKIMPGY